MTFLQPGSREESDPRETEWSSSPLMTRARLLISASILVTCDPRIQGPTRRTHSGGWGMPRQLSTTRARACARGKATGACERNVPVSY